MTATQTAPSTGSTGAGGDLFDRDALFVGGRWTVREDRPRLEIENPYTEQIIGSVPGADAQDADDAIAAAVHAFRHSPWRALSLAERAEVLARVGDELEERNDALVDTYVQDQGGVRSFGSYLTQQSAAIFREHVNIAEEIELEEWRTAGTEKNLFVLEPAGPVLAIVPWNAPLALAVIKIAPALLAGCPVVVKMAAEDPSTSFLLAEAIEAAGVPEGMVSVLPGRSRDMGGIADRTEFAHIAFTGSTDAGIGIMKQAAEHLADVTLELGGKSAGIFLEDLDPAEAGPLVMTGSLAQSGQVCTTYSRLLIPASRNQEWLDALVGIFEGAVIGDPDDPATTFGPLAFAKQRDNVERYIRIAREEGATILTGGKRPADQPHGYFVEPTLVTDVTADMTVVREEVFGPVITVQTYETLDEAVEIANSTPYGLGAGVFTADVEQGIALARRLEAGSVGINSFGACILQPYGGAKMSGLGREGGKEGVLAFLELKQIRLPMIPA